MTFSKWKLLNFTREAKEATHEALFVAVLVASTPRRFKSAFQPFTIAQPSGWLFHFKLSSKASWDPEQKEYGRNEPSSAGHLHHISDCNQIAGLVVDKLHDVENPSWIYSASRMKRPNRDSEESDDAGSGSSGSFITRIIAPFFSSRSLQDTSESYKRPKHDHDHIDLTAAENSAGSEDQEPTFSSDEEYARWLQAQFDMETEQAHNDASLIDLTSQDEASIQGDALDISNDEELARRLQEEWNLEPEDEETRRRHEEEEENRRRQEEADAAFARELAEEEQRMDRELAGEPQPVTAVEPDYWDDDIEDEPMNLTSLDARDIEDMFNAAFGGTHVPPAPYPPQLPATSPNNNPTPATSSSSALPPQLPPVFPATPSHYQHFGESPLSSPFKPSPFHAQPSVADLAKRALLLRWSFQTT
ncbi:uncharacterized protein SPPG_08812 [Spizellomyces punctatus DAOM BR117]|uniref:Uncharacterized protein n=1 Tax=Spizellomyces punctatus (strain DAOM BR117) TaxID=645134 RepID=A0A0L0HT46_SPIPD|nr:uncharacterized protein SPPG_08812 [Spizellomyces punctatus DAOM BR117]KND04288.1 hypothetical protein SPPG_08812 [Spizellomyces punctatus DAOM BR117]|eukprot:XP_016612327.1 hypothetical protein SPPG_08812 [Spizellomyces punctatus DAOM BR117]